MNSVWKILLVGLGTLLLAYMFLAGLAPERIKIERSIHVSVPPHMLFGYIACLDRSSDWSNWAELDPSLESKFSEQTCGVGAWHQWTGNQVGSGGSTIIELEPNSYIKMNVEYDEIGQSGVSEFRLDSDSKGLWLTWTFEGHESPFLTRPINLLAQPVLDQLYSRGLESLKVCAERDRFPFRLYHYLVNVEEVVIPEQTYLMEVSEIYLSELEEFQYQGSTSLHKIMEDYKIPASGLESILLLDNRDSLITIARAFPIAKEYSVPAPFICEKIDGGIGYQATVEGHDLASSAARQTRDALNSFILDNNLKIVPPIRNEFESHSDSLNNRTERFVRITCQVEESH